MSRVESAILLAPQLAAPASLGLALLAPGYAAHSGRAAKPPKAQCEAAVRP